MQELIDLALKRIDVLERKVEMYYKLLKVDNELDFIIKGTYVLQEDYDKIMAGDY